MGPTELQERIDDVNSQIADLAIQHNALCKDLIKAKAAEKAAPEPKQYRPTGEDLSEAWYGHPGTFSQVFADTAIAVLEGVLSQYRDIPCDDARPHSLWLVVEEHLESYKAEL